VSVADQTWRRQFRYDQQTLTEYLAVENRLGKQVVGVVIEGLLKGRRSEYPEDSGIWRHSSPLVYCWYRQGEPPMTPNEFYARYVWTCKEPHDTGGKRSKQCPGGVTHRLSGVHKEPVEAVYPGGIIAWIDHLMVTDPELVQQQFITLEPIIRSEWEVERWKRQVLPHEVEISHKAKLVHIHELPTGGAYQGNQVLATASEARAGFILDEPNLEYLDTLFPMVTGHGNCLRPSQCPYLDVCWGTADPGDGTRFKPRVPNHPKELELVKL
jgi:hypothetical protein